MCVLVKNRRKSAKMAVSGQKSSFLVPFKQTLNGDFSSLTPPAVLSKILSRKVYCDVGVVSVSAFFRLSESNGPSKGFILLRPIQNIAGLKGCKTIFVCVSIGSRIGRAISGVGVACPWAAERRYDRSGPWTGFRSLLAWRLRPGRRPGSGLRQ